MLSSLFLPVLLFSLVSSSSSKSMNDYCIEKGGVVDPRWPALNTNNPDNLLRLGGSRDFCKFSTLGPQDESRIYIGNITLFPIY